MNIKSRIKRLEADICPPNKKYGVLVHNYRPSRDGASYTKDGKFIGHIRAILEWANGKIKRMISVESEEGAKMLKELGYEIANKEPSEQS